MPHASNEQPALKHGGSIAITSWASVDQSPAMQTMFGALRAIKPDLPQPQRSITTLENPERFKQEMEEAGFCNIVIRQVTKAFPTGSTADFWDNMVKGSAPMQMMKKSIMSARSEKTVRGLAEVLAPSGCELVEPHSENMGEALWREKEKLALAWLKETLPALRRPLTLDAWLGVGVKCRMKKKPWSVPDCLFNYPIHFNSVSKCCYLWAIT